MITDEKWKKESGFTRYEVSNCGRIRNIHTKQEKAVRYTKTGYGITDLKENGKKKTCYVHRLVAEAFIDNPYNLPCINHKDENKRNNHAENLEWCTVQYNNRYGTHKERISETQTKLHGKSILKIDITTGEVIETFPSIVAASQNVGVTHQAIMWALKAKNHTCKGYKWEVMSDGDKRSVSA